MTEQPITKQCTKCGRQKLLSEFYKDKKGKNGFHSTCKKCEIIRVQKYNQVHKIERNEYHKNYRNSVMGCLRRRFQDIKRRCNNSKCLAYKNYGGRGIKCLFKSSQEFVDYVINKLQINPCGLDIDRINNDEHYEPENIRFVTRAENNQNRRKK